MSGFASGRERNTATVIAPFHATLGRERTKITSVRLRFPRERASCEILFQSSRLLNHGSPTSFELGNHTEPHTFEDR